MFPDLKVQSIYEQYEIRAAKERTLMHELGSAAAARRDEFLLPIGSEVGWFLHSLIRGRKPKRILEIGTSFGYSTLFLANAAKSYGGEVITLEIATNKQEFAADQLALAGLSNVVEFRLGDAVALIEQDPGDFQFVLLDIWKELYVPCFDAVYEKLSDEAILVADNMYAPAVHIPDAREYRKAVREKPDLQTTLLPIGSGIELTCRWSRQSQKL